MGRCTAFKEWAVICRAITTGRQDIILRKGGIVEPGGSFQLLAESFLLFPTFVHQSKEHLIPTALVLSIKCDPRLTTTIGIVPRNADGGYYGLCGYNKHMKFFVPTMKPFFYDFI